ncbi:MAG TPA: hypothetical protein VH309_02465 [Elusimicrobiota bacterium]|nr:hypothetical protein [Elusimicrobiota bacterium]
MTNRLTALVAFAAIGAVSAGCGGVQTVTQVTDAYQPAKHKRLAILAFQSKYADGSSMADSFLPLFMGEGFVGVDRIVVDGALEAMNVSDPSSITLEQIRKLKEQANVDVVVMGSIDAEKTGDILAVSLRAVDSQNGDVLISSSFKNEKEVDKIEIPGLMMKDIHSRLRQLAKARLREQRRLAKAEKKRQRAAAKAAAAAAKAAGTAATGAGSPTP